MERKGNSNLLFCTRIRLEETCSNIVNQSYKLLCYVRDYYLIP